MLTFYKPNKVGKGSLVSFKIAAGKSTKEDFKEGCVFVNMIRQTSWNSESHSGSFKGGESISVKLNLFELGEMINICRRGGRFNTYHASASGGTNIIFSTWQDKETKQDLGYGFQIIREKEGNKNTFQIGFKFGEGVVFEQFLKLAIEHILLANYAEEKRRMKNSMSSKSQEVIQAPAESTSVEAEEEFINNIEALFGGS